MDQNTQIKGIQYVVDASGKTTGVIISLEEWGELWEDFYDVIVSESRKPEERISWDTIKTADTSEDDVSD